jgi:anti-sigma regulatory factor (Ser/Thr protein kinase)
MLQSGSPRTVEAREDVMLPTTSAGYLGVPVSVGAARQFLARWLEHVDCPRATIETAELLVSELATNAVRHAATSFQVGIMRHEHSITVAVADESDEQPILREPNAEGGHGLRIVAQFASEWGVRQQTRGKAVFFRLPC